MPNTNFQTVHQFGAGMNQFIRQATGRDPVQNIDMEHVTVAQAKRLRVVDIFTGIPVTFTAGKDSYIGAEVGMNVKQNLNGQDFPWPAGCNKNIMPPSGVVNITENGITVTSSGNGVYYLSGTATAETVIKIPLVSSFLVPRSIFYQGAGCLYLFNDPASEDVTIEYYSGNEKITYIAINEAVKKRDDYYYIGNVTLTHIGFTISNGAKISNIACAPMFTNDGTNNATKFLPYANICPITPWESVLITVNDAEHLTEFPQTVYAGSFNTWTGELIITHKITTISALGQGSYYVQQQYFRFSTPDMERNIGDYKTIIKSSAYKTLYVAPGEDPPAVAPDYSVFNFTRAVSNDVVIRDTRYTSVGALKAAMGDTQICYPLQDPIVLQLDKEQIPAVEGENVVSTNADTLTVTLYEVV